MVLKCFEAVDLTPDPTPDPDMWSAYVTGEDFELTPTGIRFFGVDFPHVASIFIGVGPTISYGILLRDGYLRADSPVRRAWQDAKAAPAEVAKCPAARTWQTW